MNWPDSSMNLNLTLNSSQQDGLISQEVIYENPFTERTDQVCCHCKPDKPLQ